MHMWDMWTVCLQTFRNNKAYFFKKLKTSRANNSRIPRIKNVKFSGYCFILAQTCKEFFKSALVYLQEPSIVKSIPMLIYTDTLQNLKIYYIYFD